MDNQILKVFKNTECNNDLFKKWKKEFKKNVKILFQEKGYELQKKDGNSDTGVKKTKIVIDINSTR